jgi:hypothetical protein
MSIPNDSSILLIIEGSKHLSMCGLISIVKFIGPKPKADDTSPTLNAMLHYLCTRRLQRARRIDHPISLYGILMCSYIRICNTV